MIHEVASETQKNRNGGSHREIDLSPRQPIVKIEELPIRIRAAEGIQNATAVS
jgi:hypothetical protein